jgi:hypothetical protein
MVCGSRSIAEKAALQNGNAQERNKRMHDVAVAQERCCRVGVLVA